MGRSHLTNVSKIRLPRRLMDLTDIYRQYKFVITMENTEAEDYITEKLLLGLAADTIPLYFGACNVSDYFNPDRFLSYDQEGRSWKRLIERVKFLDTHDDEYLSMLYKPKQSPTQQEAERNKWKDYVRFLEKIPFPEKKAS